MHSEESFAAVTVDQMRRKQGAKWMRYGDEVLPSWVADMDFPLAPAIHDALSEQLAAHDYGYAQPMTQRPLPDIFAAWAHRRFAWSVDPSRIEGLGDIVQGIHLALQVFTEPGDGVVTLTPTYPPLWRAVEVMGRRLIDCTLHRGAQQYEIDFERLREQLDPRAKMLLLCNPHNPTGRVFTRTELEGLAELVLENDLLVLSDEIHADLVFTPNRHIPFTTLSPEIANRTITMTSATKSFNLGGLRFAIAVFGSASLQKQFNTLPMGVFGGINTLGALATEVAWRDCDEWLDALVVYLQGNRDFVVDQIRTHLPQIKINTPESTYLSWLDCSTLPINAEPFDHFLKVGKVAFSNGRDFGSGGEGFVRLNFATSGAILGNIIERMSNSIG